MHSAITRRQQAQRFNTVIDQALLAPSLQYQQQLLQLTKTIPVRQLAERTRKRATLLGKRQRGDISQLLAGRDDLIMALYASTVPQRCLKAGPALGATVPVSSWIHIIRRALVAS